MVYIILSYMIFGLFFCDYIILLLYIGVLGYYIFIGRYIYIIIFRSYRPLISFTFYELIKI